MKYVIITGGVLSGLGKGIVCSSIGKLLKICNYPVTAIKIDPYLNCDAGTMNPLEHGEVFVLSDGGEVDLDLGNYERFLGIEITRKHNITTGKVYRSVIEKERRGEYLGHTVQIIPHITNEIKDRIRSVAEGSGAEICMVEVGGTVGDIESMPYLEAIRELKLEGEDCIFIHVTLVPIMGGLKTKPTQHSVKELRGIGIDPDIIIARGKRVLTDEVKDNIALFCNVSREDVISVPDLETIYEAPLVLEEQNMLEILSRKLNLACKRSEDELIKLENFVHKIKEPTNEVKLGLIGKYMKLKDSYRSILESLIFSGAKMDCKVNIDWISAESLERSNPVARAGAGAGAGARLESLDGILIPGGFGTRGSEGKILSAKFARERDIPFLGICFGFQMAIIEFARNVLGMEGANSFEIDEDTKYPVIDYLPEQRSIDELGGTMRLGSSKILIKKGGLVHELYKSSRIEERHRHRYEVNLEYVEKMEDKGLIFSGRSADGRIEIFELQDKRFYIGSQFHPEFTSTIESPNPLFNGLISAMIKRKGEVEDI